MSNLRAIVSPEVEECKATHPTHSDLVASKSKGKRNNQKTTAEFKRRNWPILSERASSGMTPGKIGGRQRPTMFPGKRRTDNQTPRPMFYATILGNTGLPCRLDYHPAPLDLIHSISGSFLQTL
jgi:hypothetical protein